MKRNLGGYFWTLNGEKWAVQTTLGVQYGEDSAVNVDNAITVRWVNRVGLVKLDQYSCTKYMCESRGIVHYILAVAYASTNQRLAETGNLGDQT